MIRNLTRASPARFESISLNERLRGRALDRLRPEGRHGGLLRPQGQAAQPLPGLASSTGGSCAASRCSWTRPRPPACCPTGATSIFAGLKEGVSDIYLLDLETRRGQEPDPGRLRRLRSPGLARRQDRGRIRAGHQRPRQDLRRSRSTDPQKKTQLTFGALRRRRARSSPPDGNTRLLLLQRGRRHLQPAQPRPAHRASIQQYTDVLGGNMAPAPLPGQARRPRWPSSATSRASTACRPWTLAEPMREVEQDVRTAAEGLVDFQPDVVHQVVPENKRSKRSSRSCASRGGRPSTSGVTSSGDFFGGTQVGPHRRAGGPELPLHRPLRARVPQLRRDLHQPGDGASTTASAASTTRTSSIPSYYIPTYAFSRDGVARHPALSRGPPHRPVPARQVPPPRAVRPGSSTSSEQYENADDQQLVQQQAAQSGQPLLPEQRHLRARLGAPGRGDDALSRRSAPSTADLLPGRRGARRPSAALEPLHPGRRRAQVPPPRARAPSLLALRLAASTAAATTRPSSTSAATGAAGLRLPLVLGQPGLLRQRGAALPDHQPRRHADRHPRARARHALRRDRRRPLQGPAVPVRHHRAGLSYVNDPVFGEPVCGFHLVDGRASFGFGLQVFFLGYPLHFDWSKLTDLQKVVPLPVRLLDRVRFLDAPSCCTVGRRCGRRNAKSRSSRRRHFSLRLLVLLPVAHPVSSGLCPSSRSFPERLPRRVPPPCV